jgi:hypothetical protein
MKLSLVNYIFFQVGWFSCVVFAAQGRPVVGFGVALAVIGLHLFLAPRRLPEIKLILACSAIGLVFDSLLMATGWVSYPSGLWLPGLAPYWIIAMWFLFATTLNLSMGWLRGRPWLAVIAGALGGPLSYLAGEKLGGIRLENPEPALIALALAWAVIMPAIAALAQRWNGFEPAKKPDYIQSDWRDEEFSSNAL